MIIEMDGFSVILQRKRIKNINLRVRRNGEVQLSAPLKTPLNVIYDFLQHKCSWIELHRSRLQQLEPEVEMAQKLQTGEYVPFQGVAYVLQLHETGAKQQIVLKDNQIHFFIKPRASLASKQELLAQWYQAQMQLCLPELFDKWQSVIGVRANKVSIRKMKSRWGSCHPIKKHITINLRLVEKPVICLEYVIVHELVHLLEASHNARFYALMQRYMPDWKQIKNQLI